MYNSNIPSEREVPSTLQLIKSTIIAIISAIVLLLTVVMPSEYGIDPTGLGEITGLKRMGDIKTSLAKEAEATEVAQPATLEYQPAVAEETQTLASPEQNNEAKQQHEITLTLAPDQAAEVKVAMKKGAQVNYVWETTRGKVNFDVHGDSKKLKINYHPYYKGSSPKREGTLEAAFDGEHGWFWRNRTNHSLSITIKTTGEYTDIKRY